MLKLIAGIIEICLKWQKANDERLCQWLDYYHSYKLNNKKALKSNNSEHKFVAII